MPVNVPYDDERQVFRLIAEGDELAFEWIYRSYVPQLLSFMRRFSISDREADEIIQETFLRLWLQRDKLLEVDYPKAWVFRISSNIIFNYLKRSVTEAKVKNIFEANASYKHNDTEEMMHLHQLTEAIANAVNQLSPQRKRVYEMSRKQGLTIPERAVNLGLSSNTVKNTLISSLQFIREFLLKKGFDVNYLILMMITAGNCWNIS